MTAPPDTGDHQYTGQCVGGPWDMITISHWVKVFPVIEDGEKGAWVSGKYYYDPVTAVWNWSPE